MTLSEYKAQIDLLVREGHGDCIVIYASDDEGNSNHDVQYLPGIVDTEDDISNYDGIARGVAVCVN